MGWRDTLGVASPVETPHAQNSHNAQKPQEHDNNVHIVDSVHRESEYDSKLLEILAGSCRGLAITPSEVKEALTAEDIEDCRKGNWDALPALVRALVERREMDQGKRPDSYTKQATCRHCGPIWLWFSGEVLGCPWCWNRVADKPIPRPSPVQCGGCIHFERIDHPLLGHCAKGEPEAIAGLWATDRRWYDRFLPLLTQGK